MRRAVERLAAEIERALGERYPLVLAVMGGAVVFAGQLLPQLRFPLDFDYVACHALRRRRRAARGIDWRVRAAATACSGRAVLVLDDILDEGEHPGRDPQAAARARRGERSTARCWRTRRSAHEEADHRRFRRPARSPTASCSAAAWTRRALAQPAGDPRDEGQ